MPRGGWALSPSHCASGVRDQRQFSPGFLCPAAWGLGSTCMGLGHGEVHGEVDACLCPPWWLVGSLTCGDISGKKTHLALGVG